MVTFPISGIETYWWLPPLIGFLLAAVTVSGGITGAFLLLPIQVSLFGYNSPSVSGTNLIYNLISSPGSLYRFLRDKKIIWSLSLLMAAGTIPGVLLGVMLRRTLLAQEQYFKLFVGIFLLLLVIRLAYTMLRPGANGKADGSPEVAGLSNQMRFSTDKLNLLIEWESQLFSLNLVKIWLMALLIGCMSGAYGIGGGSIISPILVGMFGLPVYIVAGTTILTNYLNSIVAVIGYSLNWGNSMPATPDWLLGASFGIGGLVGGYFSARFQKFIPEKLIKVILIGCLLFISLKYIVGFITVRQVNFSQ